jgi:periplasmic protein TonB
VNLSPNLPALAAASDALPPNQRRAVVVAILALHGVAGWAVLQVPAVREALTEAAPIFVSLITPEAKPLPPEPPPPPRPQPPQPTPKLPPPPAPLIAAPPQAVPVPAAFVAPPPPELPHVAEPPAPPVVVAVQAPPAPAPAPPAPLPPAPKVIPASAVQYLVAPVVEYPRLSRRGREEGRVMVRVWIDEAGMPRTVQVSQSSGHPRLDEAAVAAVQKARFKPYSENGQPTPGWAYTPIDFDLEK